MKHDRRAAANFSLDWRIILMIVCVILSVAAIWVVPFHPENGINGNLQFGLDLEGGSWLQLEFQGEVVGFETDRSLDALIGDLSKNLDTEVIPIDETTVEIRKYYPRGDLESVFTQCGAELTSYHQGVSAGTADDVKRILEEKVNRLGTRDAKINLLTPAGSGFPQYVRVELAGVDMATAQEIVGRQGRFEIRVETAPGQSEHILFGDAITGVNVPRQYPRGSDNWGVGFTISDAGAEVLRDSALEYGAVSDPEAHNLVMILDNNTVYSAPLSRDLAAELRTGPVSNLYASTGSGEAGLASAMALEIHLRAGALPVDVHVAGSGSVPAVLGEHFKMMSLYAGILALLTVGAVVYYRYREPRIVLPMIGTNCAEIIILLGISTLFLQLDLASIAGIIAVLGTGIDQLVVITDEVLHEGRVPSPNLYLKRLGRAMTIIVIAASTTFMAMLPLALMDLSTLRGFAIITMLGVLIGVLITRPAYGRIIMAILSR